MKNRWLLFVDQFSNLSAREKWLIAGAGWVGILLLCLTFMLDPATGEKNTAQRKLNQTRNTVQVTQSEIMVLTAQLSKDPDTDIDRKLTELMAQSQALSEELSQLISSLITPSQMAELLEVVLRSSHKLKLESLQSLPAESVTQISDGSGYYLHPVRITISGEYFDIQEYLASLESMPVKYFWRSFDYQVKTYPIAEVVLEVYTLGTQQEFIGG